MGKVIDKVFSGRYFVVVCFTIALCYLVGVEASSRDAFFALAGGVIRDYFGRNDRGADKTTTATQTVTTPTPPVTP